MFNLLRNHHTVFHSSCAISYSHQHYTRVDFLCILLNTCYLLIWVFLVAILVGGILELSHDASFNGSVITNVIDCRRVFISNQGSCPPQPPLLIPPRFLNLTSVCTQLYASQPITLPLTSVPSLSWNWLNTYKFDVNEIIFAKCLEEYLAHIKRLNGCDLHGGSSDGDAIATALVFNRSKAAHF